MTRGVDVSIMHRPTGRTGPLPEGGPPTICPAAYSAPLLCRWIVERLFSWLGRQRRLKNDYEHLPSTWEARLSPGLSVFFSLAPCDPRGGGVSPPFSAILR